MKIDKPKCIILFVVICMIFLSPNASALEITSQGAAAVDAVTGTLLFEKNADAQMYPAGLTKIMTAILTLENTTMDETVLISQNALDLASGYSNSLKLSAGEELTVSDLLHCMMMVSSNEAAYALAEHVAGNVETFTDLMNKKAAALGMKNTHFANPSGIHDDNHHTTPRDMAALCLYASKNARFMEIVNTVQYRITPTNKNEDGYKFYTDNHLISKYKNAGYYYKYAQGIIGGYTSDAGYCLSSTANRKKGDIDMIVVTMNGIRENKNDPIPSYNDMLSIFEECFSNYSIKTILKGTEILGETKVALGKTKDFVTVTPLYELSLVMPIDCDTNEIEKNVTFMEDIKAPIKKGDKLGTADIVYQEKTYATVDVYASFDVEESKFLGFIDSLGNFLKSRFLKIGALLIFLLIAFYVAITVIANKRRQALMRNSRRRRYK